jgi:hypothetical protein
LPRGGGRSVVFVFSGALAFFFASLYACTYLRTIMSDSLFLLLAFPARVRYPTVTDQRSVTEAQRSNVQQNQTSSKNKAPRTAAR